MYRKGSIFAGKKYLCKVQNPIIAMKHRLLFLLAAVLLGTLPARPQPTPEHAAPRPWYCTLVPQMWLCCDRALLPQADYLRRYLDLAPADCSMSADEAVVLRLDPALAAEGYRLSVSPQRIEIAGGTAGGVFYGIQALLRRAHIASEQQILVGNTRLDSASYTVTCRGQTLELPKKDISCCPIRGRSLPAASCWTMCGGMCQRAGRTRSRPISAVCGTG